MVPLAPPPVPALSLSLRNFSPTDPGSWEPLLARAQLADQVGIDRLVVSDHVVFGEELGDYAKPELGGRAGGAQPTGPDGHWLEPMTLLSVVAGRTSRVRLATGILIAALRRPVVLAKAAATLDVLSGGRLDLGVGVGWQRAEYEAAGLTFEGRGTLLDHSLEVCQLLWREDRASLESPLLDFDAVHQMPKPIQPGGIPVWVSGRINRRVVDRVVRFGAGWIPWGDDQDEPGRGIAILREAMDAAGRGDDVLQVTAALRIVRDGDGAVDLVRSMEAVPALVDVGVTDVRVNVSIPADPSAASDLLHELVQTFRAVARRA